MTQLKNNLQAFNGNIEVFAKEDCIKNIKISIHLNLSILKALIVLQGEHYFGIPINNVETIINISDVKVMNTNSREVIIFRDKTVPLIRLGEQLNINSLEEDLNIVIVKTVSGVKALAARNIIGQKDIVIKPLGDLFREVEEIKNTAILGDGKIALILNL